MSSYRLWGNNEPLTVTPTRTVLRGAADLNVTLTVTPTVEECHPRPPRSMVGSDEHHLHLDRVLAKAHVEEGGPIQQDVQQLLFADCEQAREGDERSPPVMSWENTRGRVAQPVPSELGESLVRSRGRNRHWLL